MKKLRLILIWLFIAIPLAWGVSRSVQKALPLFKARPEAGKITQIREPH